jgi:predicted O-methyltransferase YrrM
MMAKNVRRKRAAGRTTKAKASDWFAGKTFSTDWSSAHYPVWKSLLNGRRENIAAVLEIGSWEGRSAVFFLNYFPHCSITCIDTFQGSAEHQKPEWAVHAPEAEHRFDTNLAEFGSRVEKIKASSVEALARLAIASRRFDLVFVDAGHRAADVFADAAMSWPMVVPNGIMIFDDYGWTLMPAEEDRPKRGVDAFLAAQAGQYRELHRGYQIIIEKIPARPMGAPDEYGQPNRTPQLIGDHRGFNIVRITDGYLALRKSLGEVIIDRSADDIVRDMGFANAAFGRTISEAVLHIELATLIHQFAGAKGTADNLSGAIEQISAQVRDALKAPHSSLNEANAALRDELKALHSSLNETNAALRDELKSLHSSLNETKTDTAAVIGRTGELNTRIDETSHKLNDLCDRAANLEKDMLTGATALQRSVLALSRRIKE